MFAATTETAQRLVDGVNEDILTTREPYIWEDTTVPTSDSPYYGDSNATSDIVLHALVPLLVVGLVLSFLCFCIKHLYERNWCPPTESDALSSITAIFTSVNTPPGRDTYLLTAHLREVQRQSITSNQLHDVRREPCCEAGRSNPFNEQDGSGCASHTTGAAIFHIDPAGTSPSRHMRRTSC